MTNPAIAIQPDDTTPEALMAAAPVSAALPTIGARGKLPPHDLDAEATVLGTLLLDPSRAAEVEGLESEHFYSDANATIFATIRRLGDQAELVAVKDALRDSGKLPGIGGASYLGELIDDTPACQALAKQAERIRARAEVRKRIAAVQSILVRSYEQTDPEAMRAELLTAAGQEYAAIGARRGPELPWLYGAALAEPVPENQWAIPGLQLGPGRPAMVVAYAGTAKTIAMQSALLAYAAGINVWGAFATNRGGVALHLDYEQGCHATRRRYQRIAYGLGVALEDVGDRLGMVSFPRLYLTDRDAEDALMREIEGAGLVLIDSLRAAMPGVDENASDVRRYVDLLTRVSERSQATIVLIHHSGKEKAGHTDKRQVARGSSALMDAVGCSYLIEMTSYAEPRKISQTKLPAETDGTQFEDAFLAIEDVPGPAGPKQGLRIVYQTAGQAGQADSPKAVLQDCCVRIKDTLDGSPGASLRRLRALVGGGRTVFEAALEQLLDDGEVVRMPGEGRAGGGGCQYRIGGKA